MKLVNKLIAVLLVPMLTVTVCAADSGVDSEAGEEAVSAWVIQEEIARASALTIGEELPVKSAILMEQSTGEILFSMNESEKLPPASVTKIMSLLLIMEAIDSGVISLDDQVTCSANAAGFGGSQIWLKEGEQMTVNELLKAIAIASANDATVCMAEYVAGSETAFVAMMNERARALGMTDTTFMCAAGLDTEGHLTTAKDIAIMSRELLDHPLILNYSTVWMDYLRDGATQLVNTNRMVRYYEGATGLKTGTTSGAGSCLSASAERDGLKLIAVVMGAATSDERFAAARALLDWGYATYMFAELPEVEGILPLTVTGGVEQTVELTAQPPEGIVIEKLHKDSVTQQTNVIESIEAPVERGTQVGSVAVVVNGERLLEYPIVTAAQVQEMTFRRALGMLAERMLRMG